MTIEQKRKMDGSANGVFYTETLASINGMQFTLYKEKHHSDADIKKAKAIIRSDRDVVGFSVKQVI